MRTRQSQRVLALAVQVGLAIAVGVSASAMAGPTPRTTLKLSCDRGTGSAVVTVQLEGSIFGPNIGAPITLSCGPDSISGARSETIVDTNPGVVAASYDMTVTTALGTVGCFGSSTLPAKTTCADANSVGPTLVIR